MRAASVRKTNKRFEAEEDNSLFVLEFDEIELVWTCQGFVLREGE